MPTNYTCPNALVYLTINGGDASGGNGNNTAIALMTILGTPTTTGVSQDLCATVKTNRPTVMVNEVTTVASIYALQQFFNALAEAGGTPQIGTSSTNSMGLTNAVNTLSSFLDLANGVIYPNYQPYGAQVISTSNHNITVTPEYNKIYMIADILATCVNSALPTSDACTTLFNDAVPPPVAAATSQSAASFPAATDTMMAAYYLATNPINATTAGTPDNTKMAELYNLVTPQPPFAFTAPQPTDWTIGLTYASSVVSGGSTYVLSAPTNLAIDGSGNVWYLSNTSSNVAVSELNPYGGLTNAGVTSLVPMQGLGFDFASFAYSARISSKVLYALKASVALQAAAQPEDSANSNATVLASAIAGDATNIFFPVISSGTVFQVPAVAQTSTPFTSTTVTVFPQYAVNSGHAITGLTNASGIAIDHASNIWVGGTSSNTLYQIAYNAYPSSTSSTSSTPVPYTGGAFNLPTSVAVDHGNNVWVANGVGGSPVDGFITELPSATSTPVKDTVANHGGINNPAGVAVDGAGNIWVASAGQTAAFTGQTVSELSLVGGALTAFSPSNGFAHTYTGPGSIAVDASGNVWVANAGGVATATVPGSITEILGAAVPVVTPIALGVKNNKLGSLP
ncbi:MAG TPA: hypothetical protein VGB94_03845 [Acidobacteriaceae bacterium]